MMQIDYPFHFDSRGRTAGTTEVDHIRDLIEQVLFTAPGERVNRPDFGSGLMQLGRKGTLLGYKVERRGSEVIIVSHAKEISNRRCECPASRHGEGHRKRRGIPKRCRSRSPFGAW
jgi:hypothetical protein